jgi:predicted pyridoxine 5'-phosphate oxidase superfamily flavin-nucleotide-binding protein
MQGMDGLENTTVTTVDQLTTHYARPSERVLRKEIDHVDAVGRAFIAASPFLVLATGSSHGLDCSPKGDKPGFVQVEDDGRTLLIPDRRGNNRIDSINNVVEDPRVALIFLVPGANETYGPARGRMIRDPSTPPKSRAVRGRLAGEPPSASRCAFLGSDSRRYWRQY